MYGVENVSVKDREKVKKVCDELKIEAYNLLDTKSIKIFPNIRICEDNVIENCRGEIEDTQYVHLDDFIKFLNNKFKPTKN